MSKVNKNITVEEKLVSPSTYLNRRTKGTLDGKLPARYGDHLTNIRN